MKHLNKIIVLVIALVGFNTVQAQNEENPWTVGFGLNGVNMRPSAGPSGDFADSFSNYFDVTGHWNIFPSVTYVQVGRHISGGFSAALTGSVNRINKMSGYNSATGKHFTYNPGNLSFYAVDLNAKYSFQELLDSKILDPYLYAGAGGTYLSGSGSVGANYGLGFNVWFVEGAAFTYQTGFRQQFTGIVRSHTQHLIGLTFAIGKKDEDKDGIADKDDECPTVPGLKQFNGCPDTDGDGVQDKEDECPELAGLVELKGCPDADGDGIADKDDECPKAAGTAEFKGCPDTDGDGLRDLDDKCADVAGPIENKGCPWPDTDGDGTLDKDDKCPKVKGPIENKGCPIVTKEVIQKLNTFLSQAVLFETGKTTLSAEASGILDNIAAMMIEYGNDKFRIEGHTDSVGRNDTNQKLSEGRAASIKQYLLEHGVNPDNLSSIGYGEDKPIASNKTKEGRAKNRRVEIINNTGENINKAE